MSRFGTISEKMIEKTIRENKPKNTVQNRKYIWTLFEEFCTEKNYIISKESSIEQLASILKNYAFNMKRKDGQDYKESAVKTIWNTTAALLQEKFFNEYNIKIDIFKDIEFKEARESRNTKRKLLQNLPDKRKQSSTALSVTENKKIIQLFSSDTPDGLQKKFFHVASYELAWRGGEAANCLVQHFKAEIGSDGSPTGRYEYNPIFSKTAQGGNQRMCDSKWLTPNSQNSSACPVMLLQKMLAKRTSNISTDRLFLTPNPNWQKYGNWYKSCPLGKNIISNCTSQAAEAIGIDIKSVKVTNHSKRAAAVSNLAKSGVSEQQLIKITGHSNSSSIKPYLQMDSEHHANVISQMRNTEILESAPSTSGTSQALSSAHQTIFNNCTFSVQNMYCTDLAQITQK